ncbi:ABC transporter substrate-binding protein [Pontibacillus marinus]|uniref:Sugar ABC transporter substrate-binding protein n=1 Tax=Pontibacillus marinus BH030004 = DSM 16465 TaxID=1385511 RepID=A0A0A5I4R7_9BACI|nr:sugar ABC transporter substrate-binding protein [Pontibacillus marinus]KGX90822.1 sugar ABC transporter substrate-binding protein [Pontibacillus marinus BH030004 = DSM 16465]
MKKWMGMVALLVMVMMVAAGCSSETSQGDDGKVELDYFTFSPGEAHEKDLKKMIEEFEKQNPNITINYEMAAFEDYFTKLQTRLAGGDAPDTFELNYENFVNYASKGALMDLDNLIQEDSDFSSDQLNQEAFKAFQYNGKQYGMVESFSNVVLFYNKDLFDEAGVDYPTADWTWEDELAAAQKITNKEEGVYGTYAPIQFWEFYKTIAQNGGSVFNEDMTKATVNSEANIEALQWMVDKVNKYNVTPSEEELSGQSNGDLFKAGKIAMLRTGIWMFDGFKDTDFEWDIALEPGKTQKAHHFFANGLAVSKDTEHAEAAWKWVKFMSASEEAAQIRIDNAWELPAVSNEELVQDYLEQTPPESRQVVFDALDSLVVPPVIEEWNKLTDAFSKELDLVKLGDKTPEEALNDLQPKVQDLIDK